MKLVKETELTRVSPARHLQRPEPRNHFPVEHTNSEKWFADQITAFLEPSPVPGFTPV